MTKYFTAYAINLQEVLQHRWSLLMERVRGLALILSLYFLWTALIPAQGAFLGYTKAQMVTYVLGMNFLRALVLSGRAWDMMSEIASGKLTAYLLRPLSYYGFQASRELALKSVLICSSVFEIGVLALVFRAPLYFPQHASTWAVFAAAAALSMLLYFELALLVCTTAFWTAEATGPLFCFDLFLYFAAGAFFPLDVLPALIQGILRWTPFPYLVFLPMQIFLERPQDLLRTFSIQALWAVLLALAVRRAWAAGLEDYAADGG